MIGVNDYPWPNAVCGTLNPWCDQGFRECVDFCAWRMVHDLGLACPRGWGNATFWAASARKAGYAVDGTPRVHDVATWLAGVGGASSAGHCAFVLEVGPSKHVPAGQVWVEDYNASINGSPPCDYNQHAAALVAGLEFIHTQAPPAPLPAATAQIGEGDMQAALWDATTAPWQVNQNIAWVNAAGALRHRWGPETGGISGTETIATGLVPSSTIDLFIDAPRQSVDLFARLVDGRILHAWERQSQPWSIEYVS